MICINQETYHDDVLSCRSVMWRAASDEYRCWILRVQVRVIEISRALPGQLLGMNSSELSAMPELITMMLARLDSRQLASTVVFPADHLHIGIGGEIISM